jgi:hypothetical protein
MQPHSEQLRQWASLFARETSQPVSSLRIVQHKPSSAEAIYAAKEDLIVEAEHANMVFGRGWVGAMRNAIMLRDNLTEVPDSLSKLQAVWRDPSTPSQASAADAMAKTVAALPWLAESEVVLEKMGWSRTDIERVKADKRTASVTALLQSLRPQANEALQNVAQQAPVNDAGNDG